VRLCDLDLLQDEFKVRGDELERWVWIGGRERRGGDGRQHCAHGDNQGEEAGERGAKWALLHGISLSVVDRSRLMTRIG